MLANPPFAGSLDYETTAKDLLAVVKTKKTELLFMALFLKLLKPGGRAAVIVPNGVLENDGSAYDVIRRKLVEECKLEAVIALPHFIFKPYASVATSILLFRKAAETSNVLYYKLENDGFSKGAERKPQPGSEMKVVSLAVQRHRNGTLQAVSGKSELISKHEIVSNGYDLAPAVYLSGYHLPENMEVVRLGDFFDVARGNVPAAEAGPGRYLFATTSADFKRSSKFGWDSEAIVIPTVSSTGHGHASIKSIHYLNGKFSAATITAVLTPKKSKGKDLFVPYFYYYLLAHKDQVLVPQMRGAANVSLSLERIENLKIPLPGGPDRQREAVKALVSKRGEVAKLNELLTISQSELIAELEKFGAAL